jgi:hypothetical protein
MKTHPTENTLNLTPAERVALQRQIADCEGRIENLEAKLARNSQFASGLEEGGSALSRLNAGLRKFFAGKRGNAGGMKWSAAPDNYEPDVNQANIDQQYRTALAGSPGLARFAQSLKLPQTPAK